MQFRALPEWDHPLVRLRPIAAADLPTWAGILNQPAVYEHTSWNHPDADALRAYVWQAASLEPAHALRFAIALRSNDALVGTIGFHTISPPNRSAELAYDLAPEFWGSGLASHACRLMTAWAHDEAAVVRVQATTLESNRRSARVLEAAAFEFEGLLRAYRMVRGTPGNFRLYAHVAWAAGGA